MLINDIIELRTLVPTIASNDSFEDFRPAVINASAWLADAVLGQELYDVVVGLPPSNELVILSQRVVGYKAYLAAIPTLDLVETGNGFAVINDSTLAPASTARVQALSAQIEKSLKDSLELLQKHLEEHSEYHERWQQCGGCTLLSDTLLPTLTIFLRYSVFLGSRVEYALQRPEFISIQHQNIAPVVSVELLTYLIESQTLSSSEQSLLDLLRYALVSFFVKESNRGESFLLMARRRMIDNIDEYPLYRDSQNYKSFVSVAETSNDYGNILTLI